VSPRRVKRFDPVKAPGLDADIQKLAATDRAAAGKALLMMQALLYGEEEGRRLGVRTSQGTTLDLSDCKKVYFDTDDQRVRNQTRARFRIIYREEPPAAPGGLSRINFLAVGEREQFNVYETAHNRLNRSTPARADQAKTAQARARAAAQGFPGTPGTRLNRAPTPGQQGTSPPAPRTQGRTAGPER
jgi:hypothetical protein